MKFYFSYEVEDSYYSFTQNLRIINSIINNEMLRINCGSGVHGIYIGFILVYARENYSNWFKIRKPKFVRSRKIRDLQNNVIEVNSILTFDIKFSNDELDALQSAQESNIYNILSNVILRSLPKPTELPKSIKDFDFQLLLVELQKILFKLSKQ